MLWLLLGTGLFIISGAGWLARCGQRHLRLERAELLAGWLMIVGLGCIGLSLGFCFGPPTP